MSITISVTGSTSSTFLDEYILFPLFQYRNISNLNLIKFKDFLLNATIIIILISQKYTPMHSLKHIIFVLRNKIQNKNKILHVTLDRNFITFFHSNAAMIYLTETNTIPAMF